MDLLFFSYILSLTINTLFFTDKTMHQIYEDEGIYNFVFQLPQIFYSTLISILFGVILKKLALSESLILDFKKEKNKNNLDRQMKTLFNKLKAKFILYFILSTIFILCFWYYVAMFCAVYSNTQFHLLKDILISFVTSFISPFGIYLIPGIFRIPSLSKSKSQRSYLYKFSTIIQLLI